MTGYVSLDLPRSEFWNIMSVIVDKATRQNKKPVAYEYDVQSILHSKTFVIF